MIAPRNLALLVLLAVSFLPPSSDCFAQSEVPTQAYLDQFQIVRHWWGTSSIDSSRDRIKYMTLGEKNLYVQSELGTITTFDAETGARKWVSQVGSEKAENTRIVELGDLLLVSTGMTLYAIQANDGNVRWHTSLGFATSASPGGSGDTLYFPTNSGTLYAIDVKKLNKMHEEGTLAVEAPLAIKWKFITSNPIEFSPIATDYYVSFVGGEGTVYSVAAKNHELRFRFSPGTDLAAPLVMTKDTFIVTADNFHVYNINQATGQVKWEFVSGPVIRHAPTVVDDQVFFAPENGSLFCVNLKNGHSIWESESIAGFVAASDKHVYAWDRLNNLMLLSRETGELQQRVGLQQFIHRVPNHYTDRCYVATASGLVIALRDAEAVDPIIHPSLIPDPPEGSGEKAGTDAKSEDGKSPDGESPDSDTPESETPDESTSETDGNQ